MGRTMTNDPTQPVAVRPEAAPVAATPVPAVEGTTPPDVAPVVTPVDAEVPATDAPALEPTPVEAPATTPEPVVPPAPEVTPQAVDDADPVGAVEGPDVTVPTPVMAEPPVVPAEAPEPVALPAVEATKIEEAKADASDVDAIRESQDLAAKAAEAATAAVQAQETKDAESLRAAILTVPGAEARAQVAPVESVPLVENHGANPGAPATPAAAPEVHQATTGTATPAEVINQPN